MSNSSIKTYLVTGAAGFIGSAFVESCLEAGISVVAVDQKSHFETRIEKRGIGFTQIIDREILLSWLNTSSPKLDAIVHLGAVTDTRVTDLQLLDHLNLNYSQSLWTYASLNQIPLIYASSAATYGDGQQGYQDHEEKIPLLIPLNPYGRSKQEFDLWALKEEKKGIKPPVWAGFKFFNVYGYGERHKGFMSSVVLHAFDEILKTGQSTLFMSHRAEIDHGYQRRDFIFVQDVVQALHFALCKPILRGIFNLGSGNARTFLDLVQSVFAALKVPEKVRFIETPLSIRDKYQYFTQAAMERFLAEGFQQPFTPLEVGVACYVKRLKGGA